MKHQIATTPEQSQCLIACGVNPDSADMMWYSLGDDKDFNLYAVEWETSRIKNRKITTHSIPAWSLSALLELLRNRILVDDAWYECQICKCPFGYEVRYHSDAFKDSFGCLCKNPIEGCVEAIKYLTANGYTLNTK